MTPSAAEQAITTHAVARPSHASAARLPLKAIAASCEPRISFRRSNRSAHDPAQGASSSTGANWQNASTPSRNAEWVSRKTRIEPARFWNHVPLAEAALPAKYGPKFRERITRQAAPGPTCGSPDKYLSPAGFVQLGVDTARRLGRYARDAFKLLFGRLQHPLGRPEVLQQRPAARRPDALDLVEHRLACGRIAALPVEGHGEAMRLVADALQQLQAWRMVGQQDRLGTSRNEDLLDSLGERDDRDAR